ncbi:MAG: carboxypeptidase-like regulatory domain-containing protein [Flavobacteriales bacterium]|nr:carboxypeptidase-like regulatory domain-containing protein [Flavobacteriales bacterium]
MPSRTLQLIKHILQCLAFIFCITLPTYAQVVNGYVLDENNTGIPGANIYIKNTETGTATDSKGRYFFRFENADSYELIYSVVGYKTKSIWVTVKPGESVRQDVWMEPEKIGLEEVVVTAKRKDPAYDIIRKVIQNKDRFSEQYQGIRYRQYCKANRILKESQEQENEKTNDDTADLRGQLMNDTLSADSVLTKYQPSVSVFERRVIIHRRPPHDFKEVVEAEKKSGNTHNLYEASPTRGEFNIYNNLILMEDVSETPFISPLSRLATISYRYKLESSDFDLDEELIYKIRVWPWKHGNSTLEGYLWIGAKSLSVIRLELSIEKGAMLWYDAFEVRQDFDWIRDTITLPVRTEYNYSVGKRNKSAFRGTTLVIRSDFEIDPVFKPRFFNNAIGEVLEGAREKDTTYWNLERPEPLTQDEQKSIFYHDSVKAYLTSDVYLDSLEREYNRVTLGKLVYHGQGRQIRKKKKGWYFGSLLDFVQPVRPGGVRVAPYVSYTKMFENKKFILVYPGVSYGFRNKDFKGSINSRIRYDAFHRGMININLYHDFTTIFPNDALLNQIRRSNFAEEDGLEVIHSREIFNGFYLGTYAFYKHTYPISDYEFGSLADKYVADNRPVDFEPFRSVVVSAWMGYTFKQKFIKEPKQKIVLGSKWPTIRFAYKKGLKGFWESNIDFDYAEAMITQRIQMGTLGTSNYSALIGKFLNQRKVPYVNHKILPRGDIYYSNPLATFQLLDSTLHLFNVFYELHYIHHFNGAMINNIPLVKKTRVYLVGGGGALYATDNNLRYIEGFAGIERVIRIQRQRIRLGVYGVLAESNQSFPKGNVKFSLEWFSNRRNEWNW